MFIVDTHCDTLMALSMTEANPFSGSHETQVTPERLRDGGVTLQVCALFAGPDGPKGVGPRAPRAVADAELAALPLLTEKGVRKVDNPFDAKEGETCLMLSIEGGEIIGDSLEALHTFRNAGVRLFSLTWNHENLIAYPHCSGGQHGLKPFGWEVVREMATLGMAVDVAHLGEGGFWDLIFHEEKPPMTSHSCCRKLHNHTRNLTDDQIKALIDAGGWMGINFYTNFLTAEKTATAEIVVDHIAHVADLGGIANVGFGSDFDGIESAPVDVQHPGEVPNILRAMERRGFSGEEIEGVAGKNFLNYFKKIDNA